MRPQTVDSGLTRQPEARRDRAVLEASVGSRLQSGSSWRGSVACAALPTRGGGLAAHERAKSVPELLRPRGGGSAGDGRAHTVAVWCWHLQVGQHRSRSRRSPATRVIARIDAQRAVLHLHRRMRREPPRSRANVRDSDGRATDGTPPTSALKETKIRERSRIIYFTTAKVAPDTTCSPSFLASSKIFF